MDFEIIEREFDNMRSNYLKTKKKGSGTSCKDVLQFMVENYEKQKWWWSWDFAFKTTQNGRFLSHKAPARASDLALHTDLVESRKIGRYCVYRVKKENREKVLEFLKNN